MFLRPNFPEATLLLAQIDINKGDLSTAINSLTGLIRRQPSGDAYLMIAMAYVSQKNYDQALSAYAKLAEMLPKNPEFAMLSGMVYVQKNDPAAGPQVV